MRDKVIAALRRDGRAPLTALARLLKRDVDDIHRIIKEEEGTTITKFTSLLNYELLGYPTHVVMVLAVSSKERAAFTSFLNKSQHLNGLFSINNGYDFLLDLIFKDMRQVHSFVEQLESKFTIYERKEYYILATFAEQRFMANPDLLPQESRARDFHRVPQQPLP